MIASDARESKHLKVLVTGASGTLGRSAVETLPRLGHTVVGLTRRELDITDRAAVASVLIEHEPSHLFNCAAAAQVDACEGDPARAEAVNARAPAILAESCAERGIGFVHYSTDYVFAGDEPRPRGEQDPAGPASVYGKSKLRGEEAVLGGAPDALVIRSAWIFRPGGRNFLCRLPGLLQAELHLPVVGDKFSSPTYAPDLIEITCRLVAARARGLFHAVNEGNTTWLELAGFLLLAMRDRGIPTATESLLPIALSSLPGPSIRPRFSALENARLCAELGIRPRPWQESVLHLLPRVDGGSGGESPGGGAP